MARSARLISTASSSEMTVPTGTVISANRKVLPSALTKRASSSRSR